MPFGGGFEISGLRGSSLIARSNSLRASAQRPVAGPSTRPHGKPRDLRQNPSGKLQLGARGVIIVQGATEIKGPGEMDFAESGWSWRPLRCFPSRFRDAKRCPPGSRSDEDAVGPARSRRGQNAGRARSPAREIHGVYLAALFFEPYRLHVEIVGGRVGRQRWSRAALPPPICLPEVDWRWSGRFRFGS